MSIEFDWFLCGLGAVAFLYTIWLCRAFALIRELTEPTPPRPLGEPAAAGPTVAVVLIADPTRTTPTRADATTTGLATAWSTQRGVEFEVIEQDVAQDSEVPPLAASLQSAVERSDADWLLLCCLPVRPTTEDCLARAIAHAQTRDLAALSLIPRETGSWRSWGRLPTWTGMLHEIACSNGRHGDDYESPGQLVPRLLRRSLWQRATVDGEAFHHDPCPLARLDRTAGTIRSGFGVALASGMLRWSDDRAAARINVGERLYVYDATGYRAGIALGIALAVAATLIYGIWSSATADSFWGVFALAGLTSFAIPAWHLAPLVGIPRLAALIAPLMSLLTMLRDLPRFVPPMLTGRLRIDGRRFELARLRDATRSRRANERDSD